VFVRGRGFDDAAPCDRATSSVVARKIPPKFPVTLGTMTASGGNGNLNDEGWGFRPQSSPPRNPAPGPNAPASGHDAVTSEFPPQPGHAPPPQGSPRFSPPTPPPGNAPPPPPPPTGFPPSGFPPSGFPPQAASGKPPRKRRKWIPVVAILAIIPVAVAAGYFGMNALGDSDDGDDATGLVVRAADPQERDGRSEATSSGQPPATAPDRPHFESGSITSRHIDDIKGEPFISGDWNSTDAPSLPQGAFTGPYLHQEDTEGRTDDSTFRARIEIIARGGWIEYPSLNCSGTLQYIGIQGGTRVYEEVITTGRRNCADTGTWWFRADPDNPDDIAGYYESTEGRWRVTGLFTLDES